VTTLEAINQTINIGADRPYSVKTLAEIVAAQFSISPNIEYLPARNEVLNAYADHSKAYRIFNIQNTVPLDEGVKQMADWAKKVGVRKSQVFHNIEVSKNMPVSWKSVIE
jgi:UDP-glucose 4-epimerase